MQPVLTPYQSTESTGRTGLGADGSLLGAPPSDSGAVCRDRVEGSSDISPSLPWFLSLIEQSAQTLS